MTVQTEAHWSAITSTERGVRCEACHMRVQEGYVYGPVACLLNVILCADCARGLVASVARREGSVAPHHEGGRTGDVSVTLTWSPTDLLSVTEVSVLPDGMTSPGEHRLLGLAAIRLRRYIDGYRAALVADQAKEEWS